MQGKRKPRGWQRGICPKGAMGAEKRLYRTVEAEGGKRRGGVWFLGGPKENQIKRGGVGERSSKEKNRSQKGGREVAWTIASKMHVGVV